MKVPDKLSEVLGDVLELACGGGGNSGNAGNAAGSADQNKSSATAIATNATNPLSNNEQQPQQQQKIFSSYPVVSRFSSVTGVALIKERWAQRQARSSLTSSGATNNDSADSSVSNTSSSDVSTNHSQKPHFLLLYI